MDRVIVPPGRVTECLIGALFDRSIIFFLKGGSQKKVYIVFFSNLDKEAIVMGEKKNI